MTSSSIHPTALVGPHAELAADCTLHPYAIVGAHTILGPGCVVHPFAVVGGPAQDRRTDPDAPFRLVCGAGNVFREGVTVSRGTDHGGGTTRLGDRNLLMAQAHIGHDSVLGDDNTLANGVSLAGHVVIGDRVNLGGHAAVHQFARIGDLAFVAANAMVSRDVPPYCLAAGDRATIRGLNLTGLQRAGFDADTIAALKRALRAILAPGVRREAAEAHRDHPVEAVRRLARFCLESERGISRRGR